MSRNSFIRRLRSIVSLPYQRNAGTISPSRNLHSYPRIMDRSRKRNLDDKGDEDSEILSSLSRPISPPLKRIRRVQAQKSPWQLTRIRDLPEELNKDTIRLQDILGDPLITECWQFNFLHDIPFVMSAFDELVRDRVQLHVVHGFWKKSDSSRVVLSVRGH